MEPIRITAADFKQAVLLDPAWTSRLTEPVEVTGFCDMKGSNISHLSPQLTFSGRNPDGWAADFTGCKKLEIAAGTFHGLAKFSSSGVREIGELEVTRPGNSGVAATFDGCDNLKTARGKFAGAAFFTASGIREITDLQTTAVPSPRNPEKKLGADFCGCLNLAPDQQRQPRWQPEWNTAPNKLAHFFARLVHKLDSLAERLLDIGQVAIANAEHLEKTADSLHSTGMEKILNAAARLELSNGQKKPEGIRRIEQSWKDLFDFVSDATQHGAATALSNLIERQFGTIGKSDPTHKKPTKTNEEITMG
jgi:hypothetical protein